MNAIEILEFLRPNEGWTIYQNDLSKVVYDENVAPITETEIATAVAALETKKQQEIAAKNAVIEKLGITADEAKLLLS